MYLSLSVPPEWILQTMSSYLVLLGLATRKNIYNVLKWDDSHITQTIMYRHSPRAQIDEKLQLNFEFSQFTHLHLTIFWHNVVSMIVRWSIFMTTYKHIYICRNIVINDAQQLCWLCLLARTGPCVSGPFRFSLSFWRRLWSMASIKWGNTCWKYLTQR